MFVGYRTDGPNSASACNAGTEVALQENTTAACKLSKQIIGCKCLAAARILASGSVHTMSSYGDYRALSDTEYLIS